MVRRFFTPLVALLVVAACADSPTDPTVELVDDVLEAAWDYKITGGGTWTADGGLASERLVDLTMSVTDFGEDGKGVTGEVQASRTGFFSFHAEVVCVNVYVNGAGQTEAIVGSLITQSQEGSFVPGQGFVIRVAEDSDNGGDLGRWSVRAELTVRNLCETGYSRDGSVDLTFNSLLTDGNVNIREK